MDTKELKRIWIFNHHAALPEHGWGTRHFDIASELAKRGYDVTIFASSYLHNTHKYNNEEKLTMQNINGVKFIWLRTAPAYKKNGISRIMNMLDYMLKVIRQYPKHDKPDIIIASSVHPFAWVAADYLCRKHGIRFIAEVRDLWPATIIELGNVTKFNPIVALFKVIEKRTYLRSDAIITLLPGLYDYLSKYNIDPSKCFYIPNGSAIQETIQPFGSNPIVDEIIESIRKNPFRCVYAGSITKSEGLLTVLIAADLVQKSGNNDITFHIIGEGDQKDELISFCEAKRINNVKFYPRVPKQYVFSIIKEADILLISLLDKSIYRFGISLNKLFDYMYAKKPILFSGNVYSNPVELSTSGICTKPESPEDFYNGLIKLYNMSCDEREKMGERGYQYVKSNHSIPALADKLIDCIDYVFKQKTAT